MKVLPISQTLRIPGALMTCLLFLTFCARIYLGKFRDKIKKYLK